MSNPYVESITRAADAYPEKEFGSAVRQHFDNIGELNKLADAFCFVGHFEQAAKLYERILELNPGWFDFIDIHARALWALHDYQGAISTWERFLKKRSERYRKLGIPLEFYTIDDVFTASFGNFVHFYPMTKFGYKTSADVFYDHRTRISEGKRSLSVPFNKSISNEAVRNNLFSVIKPEIPENIQDLLEEDDYVTRLPFYCATDMKRKPTHFHNAFAEKTLAVNRDGRDVSLHYSDEEMARCKAQLSAMGVAPGRPWVALHARESGYWNRTGDRTHSTKNANILSYLPAIQFLTDNGYQVIRLGDPSMVSLPPMDHVFDYARSEDKNDFLDLYILKHCAFMICTCSGPFAVASVLNVPVLATNWIPVHLLPFSARDLILLKKLKYKSSGQILSLKEMLDLPFGEFSYYIFQRKGIEVIDNTPVELLGAAKAMLAKLHQTPARPKPQEPTLAGKILKLFSSADRFYGKAIVSEAEFVVGLS